MFILVSGGVKPDNSGFSKYLKINPKKGKIFN
jgi:hypothetical protein